MLVCVLGRRVDHVHVEIHRRFHQSEPGDPRLLGGLPQSHPAQVGVTVGMATGLEPTLELGVEEHQDPTVHRIDDQGRTGQVSRPTGPVEHTGTGVGPGTGIKQGEDPLTLDTRGTRLDRRPGIVNRPVSQVGQIR